MQVLSSITLLLVYSILPFQNVTKNSFLDSDTKKFPDRKGVEMVGLSLFRVMVEILNHTQEIFI